MHNYIINAQININDVEPTRSNKGAKWCTIIWLMAIFVANQTKNHPFPLK